MKPVKRLEYLQLSILIVFSIGSHSLDLFRFLLSLIQMLLMLFFALASYNYHHFYCHKSDHYVIKMFPKKAIMEIVRITSWDAALVAGLVKCNLVHDLHI